MAQVLSLRGIGSQLDEKFHDENAAARMRALYRRNQVAARIAHLDLPDRLDPVGTIVAAIVQTEQGYLVRLALDRGEAFDLAVKLLQQAKP